MNIETANKTTRKSHERLYDEELLNQELHYLWEDRDSSGKSYEIFLGKISKSPIIKSKRTGRYFALPWSKIIELAVKEGIDD